MNGGRGTLVPAALLALLVAGAAAGCSSPQLPTAPAVSDDAGPVTPKVNRVVMSISGWPAEGNVARQILQTSIFQLRPMYEYVLGIDPEKGTLTPQLATEWALEPDGQSYRFKLRRGVQFHGGWGEFTGHDVLYTWKDFIQPDTQHGLLSFWKTITRDVEVVNDYEVVFRNTDRDADFLNVLSEAQGTMEIQSRKHFESEWAGKGEPGMRDKPVAGTGPYQYQSREQGQYIRYERPPFEHWRVTPDFPEFEYRVQREPSTRLASPLTRDVHVTNLPDDLLDQASSRGMTVARGRVPALRTFVAFMCCWVKAGLLAPDKGVDGPLVDVRVRRALSKAINRDELNKAFFKGEAEAMKAQSVFHPSWEGWNPDWERRFPEQYGYDVARARALLTEAGYGPGRPLKTSMIVENLAQYSGAPDVAEAIAGYWRAVGAEVDLVTMDAATQTARRRALTLDNFTAIQATSAGQFIGWQAYQGSPGLNPGGHFDDPVLREPYELVRRELVPDRREQLWRNLGNIAYDVHGTIPLFFLPAKAVMHPEILRDYVFPGSISGTWTHPENLRAAR